MKKLLLTLMAGFAVTSGFSQSANSVVFLEKGLSNEALVPVESGMLTELKSGNKTTADGNSWFDYVAVTANPNTESYYSVIYQDSNIVHQTTSGPLHNQIFGFGRSFDPTDSIYFIDVTRQGLSVPLEINADAQPSFRVFPNHSYIIDSIAFYSSYERKEPVDDTLIIQYAKVRKQGTNPRGIYVLQFSTLHQVAADSSPSFATFAFDQETNMFTQDVMGTVHTQKIVLDAAFFADTGANGLSTITTNGIELQTPLNLNAGETSIFWITFKSGFDYPLGKSVDSANHLRRYVYDINGDGQPLQTVGSLESALIATKATKYSPTYDSFAWDGYNIPIPNIAYSSGLGTYIPSMAFHISCTDCVPVGINDVNTNEIKANAYPNPAQNMVKIPFSISASSNVEVSLTNTLGQVVSRENLSNVTKGEVIFNTTSLPNGVYFYKVEANGKSATGRVVISH